jgi:gas vesicle protein
MMNKTLSWLLGIGLGSLAGALLVMFFAPVSGQQVMAQLKRGWAGSLEAARKANSARQAELEADLARRQGKTPALPATINNAK